MIYVIVGLGVLAIAVLWLFLAFGALWNKEQGRPACYPNPLARRRAAARSVNVMAHEFHEESPCCTYIYGQNCGLPVPWEEDLLLRRN